MEHPLQQVLKVLGKKGWGLFLRPPDKPFSVEESVSQGPVDEITSAGGYYDLLPRVSTKVELDQVFEKFPEEMRYPTIRVPSGIFPGEATWRVSGNSEVILRAGTQVEWATLSVEEAGVIITINPDEGPEASLSIRAFLLALESLEDITSLLPRERKQSSHRG